MAPAMDHKEYFESAIAMASAKALVTGRILDYDLLLAMVPVRCPEMDRMLNCVMACMLALGWIISMNLRWLIRRLL